jgi:hypothetical protein
MELEMKENITQYQNNYFDQYNDLDQIVKSNDSTHPVMYNCC